MNPAAWSSDRSGAYVNVRIATPQSILLPSIFYSISCRSWVIDSAPI